MRFTVSTKPLKNVTNLGIIQANISQFYHRSGVVQITATRDILKLNIEAASIKTRMTLGGSGDSDTPASVMVECAKFKKLIDSIDNDIISIEFVAGGITVYAGTSKFSLPQVIDVSDVQLDEPADEYTATNTVEIKSADWQFVKDHQMYALSASEEHPVYRNVWVGEDGGVIVGDFDTGLFTYSKRGSFDTTCLLPSSLINLFTAIPEGSTVSKIGNSYILKIETDSYSMITEFTPKYESDSAVGSYNSEIIMNTLKHPDSYITLDIAPIVKFINQTSIVNQSNLDKLFDLEVNSGKLTLTNRISNYAMEVDTDANYKVKFVTEFIKKVLANLDADTVNMAPMMRMMPGADGQPVEMAIGCIFWTDNLTAVLAGQG